MSNRITASLEFSFRGETFHLHKVFDLDETLAQHIELSSLHRALAVAHGIDTYSYQFEVMLEEEITFDHPQGDALMYWQDGVFDYAAYLRDHQNASLFAPLQAIALREMGIADLEQHPQLKSALLHAYQLGAEQ